MTPWVASVSACVGTNQRIPVSVLARNPHKWPMFEIFHETGSGRGKKGPREDRRRQSAEGSSRNQSAAAGSPEKDTISRREKRSVGMRGSQEKTVGRRGQLRDESALLMALREFSL